MKISIITPAKNSSACIQDNLRSIHLDNSGGNEYQVEQIIIDGGSTDPTLDIINGFISEYSIKNIRIIRGRDRNMYDAINKGLVTIDGDVWAVLNSDDYYMPNALATVNGIFKSAPEMSVVFGNYIIYDEINSNRNHLKLTNINFKELLASRHCTFLPQPTAFLRKKIIDVVGLFDISYSYASDYDYFLRVLSMNKLKTQHINIDVTLFRRHTNALSTTHKNEMTKERLDIVSKYICSSGSNEFNLWLRKLYVWGRYLYCNKKVIIANKLGISARV